MRSQEWIRSALSISVAAALPAGCGALRQAQDDMQPPIGAPGTIPQSRANPKSHAFPLFQSAIPLRGRRRWSGSHGDLDRRQGQPLRYH